MAEMVSPRAPLGPDVNPDSRFRSLLRSTHTSFARRVSFPAWKQVPGSDRLACPEMP